MLTCGLEINQTELLRIGWSGDSVSLISSRCLVLHGSFCLSMNMDRECSRVTVKWDHAHVVHDLTKAFNKVNHHALYIKLMKRNIPVQGSFKVTGNGTIA